MSDLAKRLRDLAHRQDEMGGLLGNTPATTLREAAEQLEALQPEPGEVVVQLTRDKAERYCKGNGVDPATERPTYVESARHVRESIRSALEESS